MSGKDEIVAKESWSFELFQLLVALGLDSCTGRFTEYQDVCTYQKCRVPLYDCHRTRRFSIRRQQLFDEINIGKFDGMTPG